MLTLTQTATLYRQYGYSVLPVDVHKKCLVRWHNYQHWRMSPAAIQRWFEDPRCEGIAVLCGPISGNLEIIDFDCKNDLTGKLMQGFGTQLRQHYPDMLTKLVIATTRNNGYHFLYRCPGIGRCSILASRPATPAELLANPHAKVKVLIETRATGGYGIVEPTRGYRFLQGSLRSVQELTLHDRNLLHDLARTFNILPPPVPTEQPTLRVVRGPESPLDDFDIRGDLQALLTSYGWIYVRTKADRSYYRRPGETDHDTSGDYHHGLGLFSVFSTSTEFVPWQPYRPSAVYAVLACQGNFRLAAKKLVQAGFGIPYSKIWW